MELGPAPALLILPCGSHSQKAQPQVNPQVGTEGEGTEILLSPKIPVHPPGPGIPGRALLPLLTSPSTPGCRAGLHAPGRDVSSSTRPALPNLHPPLQTPAPSRQALKLRLISPALPAAPRLGKCFVRAFCEPEKRPPPTKPSRACNKAPRGRGGFPLDALGGAPAAGASWRIPEELTACGIWDDPKHLPKAAQSVPITPRGL